MATVFNRTFTYKELGATTYGKDGMPVKGSLSVRQVRGTIQALTGQDVITYLNGSRNSGTVKIYSSERLNARKQGGDAVGYVESAAGVLYELTHELPFQNLSRIGHWKYIASEVPAAQIPEALR